MDILIKGSGDVVICFIDRSGKTLVQESMRSSGSATTITRRPMDLVVHTRGGRVPVSPVLASCGGKQQVTFDGDEPAAYTRRRCQEIGSAEGVIETAGRGQAQLLRTDPAQKPGPFLARIDQPLGRT
jgi:hypothetical protein